MQLQHHLTISQACLLEQLTVELVPNSPVEVSPFIFCPPDGPAAVEYLDMPIAITWPSLLQSEIAEGFLHRELIPLAHSRRPLARRRPHLHRGVCVCVCVCVCNIRLIFFLCYSSISLIPTSSVFPFPSVPQLYANSNISLALRQQPLNPCPTSLMSSRFVLPDRSPSI